MSRFVPLLFLALIGCQSEAPPPAKEPPKIAAGELWAGVAKVDITDTKAGPVNDPLYAKALVLRDATTMAVIITVDAVAIGEIGPIRNDYLPKVRAALEKDLGIAPAQVVVNASHCHGIVAGDVDERTIAAVKEAMGKMVPVTVGVGVGHEDRIMENRRIKLKNGTTLDVRHAYSVPPDEEIEAVGPTDPKIGIVRLNRRDGKTLAVLYQFACHPIQGAASGGNTADLTGHASRIIEANLDDGAIALFMQGCGGDINPVQYKDVHNPRDGEIHGQRLALSVLREVRKIETKAAGPLRIMQERLALPRANLAERITALEAEQVRLVRSLRGTSLNFKTFAPLLVQYELGKDYPSYSAHRYLHEKQIGREDLARLDAENRRNMRAYLDNILTMEKLTQLQTNLALLRKHHEQYIAAERKPIEVEMMGLRLGEFVLVTFPGELTVEIGLSLQKQSPHPRTFISGYTNGYIYYAPTPEQLKNVGGAQEDSDCILAPEWYEMFEQRALAMLKKLG